jgi:hypothetical protein
MWIILIVLLAAACSASAEEATETFGALPDALGPIGGGPGYKNVLTKGNFAADTVDGLIDALAKAKAGQVVYVNEDVELDFTLRVMLGKLVLQVPEGVTLASGRGNNGSKGALIFSDHFDTRPLIKIGGPNARITGIRLQGPDPRNRWDEIPKLLDKGGQELYYKFPVSDGIGSGFAGLEVDNCEISGWSHTGVALVKGSDKARVHHSSIHHCQRRGLGYGVAVDQCEALIESNIFEHCRHSVAATGAPGTAYEARNNIIEEYGILSSFDMHGGGDRKDGTNIAGEWIKIHHNTCKGKWKGSDGSAKGKCVPAVGIRGVPSQGGEIHHNWFCSPNVEQALFKDPNPNVKVYRNQYGPERTVKE